MIQTLPTVVVIDYERSGQARVPPPVVLDMISPGSDIVVFARKRIDQARLQSSKMLQEAVDYMKTACDVEAVMEMDMPDRPRWQSPYGPAARPGRR